jgi:hypothetical protein
MDESEPEGRNFWKRNKGNQKEYPHYQSLNCPPAYSLVAGTYHSEGLERIPCERDEEERLLAVLTTFLGQQISPMQGRGGEVCNRLFKHTPFLGIAVSGSEHRSSPACSGSWH